MSGTKSITGILLTNQTISTAYAPGTPVGKITVSTSDGQSFTGDLTISGIFAQAFNIVKSRTSYNIASIHLSNAAIPAGAPVGTKVGDVAVTDDDGLPFGGSIVVDDAVHFAMSGTSLVTNAVLTAQNYPLKITAIDSSSQNLQLSINVQISATATLPAAPTLTATGSTSTTASVGITLPPTGPMDTGNIQLEYKASSSGTYLNASAIPYLTPGHGNFTDAFGNIWLLDATKHPSVNNAQDVQSNANLMMLVAGTVWQQDLGGNWYSITPTGTINSATNLWQGPAASSPLSSVTVSGLAASTTYNFQAYVSNSSGNGALSSVLSEATQAAQVTPGTGPAATSSFLTIDFTSPMNYVSPGSGQQVVSPWIWGNSTGAAGNSGFYPFTVDAWCSVMAQINFGLWYFVGNLAPGAYPPELPPNPWFDSNQNVRPAAMNNLINNFYKVDPLGVGGIILSLDFENTSAAVVSTQTQWLNAMKNLATFFYNGGAGRTMPNNGKPCPVIGFAGHNEPGDQTTTQNHYAQLVPAIHAINPNYKIFGPLGADFGVINLSQFLSAVPNMDVTAWDAFVSQNSNLGSQVWQNSGFINWYAGTIRPNGLPYQPKGVGIFGNIDTGCTDPAQENGNGALWGIQQIITCQNVCPQQFYQGFWDAYDDGTCGIVDGPVVPTSTSTYRISPLGYAMAQGVRHITGPRWNVTTNPNGLLVMATTPTTTPGKFGVMIVNSGGAQSSQRVALSHVPTGSGMDPSGNGTATVWQITSGAQLGQNGTSSNVAVTQGVTGAISFPTGSVTIISI